MAVTLTSQYQLLGSANSSTYSQVRLYGKLDGQDVANNKSTITLQLRIYGNGGSATAPYTYSGMFSRLYVQGGLPNSTEEQTETSIYYTKGKETTLFTHSFDLPHSSDGSLLNRQVSGRLYVSSNFGASTPAEINLPTIPRASTIVNTSIELLGTQEITINSSSQSFTHNLTYSLGSQSGTIATGVGSSYNWTIPNTLYTELSSTEKSKQGTITCVTMDGATTIGTTTKTIDFEISSIWSPWMPQGYTKTETNQDVIDAIGTTMQEIIIGLSKPRYMSILVESLGGAYLKSIFFKCGDFTNTIDLTASSITNYQLDYTFTNAMTSNVVQITITDTRDMSRTYTDTFNNYQIYENPTITYQSVERTDLNGEVSIYLTGTMQPENIDGVTANSISGAYRYKENSESATWSSLITLPNATYNQENTEWTINYTSDSQNRWALYNKSWIVEITIADGSTPNTPQTRTYTINKAVPTISLGETDLQVNGDLFVADEDGQNARNVLEDIGDLSALDTTNQDSLVEAINEVNSQVSTGVIGLRMSANQSISVTTDTKIKVDTIDYQVGNKFTLNSSTYEITIGSGVNHILVSASVVIGQFTTNGLRRLFAKKNGTNFARAFTYYNQQYMNSLVIPPRLIAVSQGDKITFSMTNAGASTIAGTDVDSWFTLQVID